MAFMPVNFKRLVVVTGVLLISGCAPSGHNRGGYEYEVAATSLDEAQAEVASAPTQFFVSQQDDRYAWERARYFLENYAGGPGTAEAQIVTKLVGKRWGLVKIGDEKQQPYAYEVWKAPVANGFSYSVECLSVGESAEEHQKQAQLNAGNLSLFITQGKLEVSLLKKP